MEMVPANQSLTFEVSYDAANLNVGMRVFDTTTGTPTIVQGPTPMVAIPGSNTYTAAFTPQLNHTYAIIKAVYTDSTYTTVDLDFSQGSESIVGVSQTGAGGTILNYISPVIGLINNPQPLIGFVNC